MDRCEGCGFDYELSAASDAGAMIEAGAEEIAELVRGAGDVRSRRLPEAWSPLEYACHVRDVLLVQRERVLAARRFDRPEVMPMGREERVDHDGYAEQDPDDVARQLLDAAHLLANVFARLDPDAWERTVVYNYPVRSERSLRWIAVHTVHEVVHHLGDVRAQVG